MNTPNNSRKRASIARIEQAFIELLQTHTLETIHVSELCKRAGCNRTTFYANYPDIYGLADALRDRLENSLYTLYRTEYEHRFNSNDYLKLFRHIYANQALYRTYFKLGYDGQYRIIHYDTQLAWSHFQNQHIHYHMEFFRAGITRIIKMWLEEGCPESPETMVAILQSEYRGRTG